VVVVTTLPLHDSAAFLLVTSLAMIAFSAIGAPYETTMLVRFGTRYGASAPLGRAPFAHLMVHAATRLGPLLIVFLAACVAATLLLSPDLATSTVTSIGACLLLQPVVQTASTPLTAHLYVTRHFAAVYLSSVFRGGPTILVALLWSQPLAIAISYTLGELLRVAYLRWRVSKSLADVPKDKALDIDPPSWAELAPQSVASMSGQALPLVIQGALAASGAQAVAAGSIALRVWGAAFQVGTSTIAMPEVVKLTQVLSHTSPVRDARKHVQRRGVIVLGTSAAMSLVLLGMIAIVVIQPTWRVGDDVAIGLVWSLTALAGIPPAMLNFWAGRGLVTLGKGWSLPLAVGAGFALGLLVCAFGVPLLGGLGAMVAQVVNFTVMGLMSSWLLLRCLRR